jgi:LPXTG-motif cell wall-anchored protein
VIVPSLLPPPIPFKPFVLIAGIAKVRPIDFLLAVGLGRGARYFGEGLLAYRYGERAADFLKTNAQTVSLIVAAIALIGGAGWIWFKSRRASAP